MDNIIESPNCIAKAFENHPIFIFNKEINNKKVYYFKASDVGLALGISNIRPSLQNFTEKEKCINKVDTLGGKQDIIFLTSQGVYRLIYNSKKPVAEKFREWIGDILDDIIFNDSLNLKKMISDKDEKIKLLELNHASEIAIKENEKNWLHKITKNKVTFKKFTNKTDGVYIGSATFEHENYIEKIGKSVNVKKREEGLKTASVEANMFSIHKNFELYDTMEYPTERYIQSLLNPFHVNSEKGSSEHFMIHQAFAVKIINKTIAEQNETINMINNYIDLLVANNYDYNTLSMPSIKLEKNIETKSCTDCNQTLEISKFFLLDEKNNIYNEKCNTCVSNFSDNLKSGINDSSFNGKKQCIDCNQVYNFDMFYTDKNNKNLLWSSCRQCHITKEKNPTKQCCECYEVFQYNNFRKGKSFKDGHTSKCKDCNSKETIKVICDICQFQVLKQNLKNHQNSIACKESQITTPEFNIVNIVEEIAIVLEPVIQEVTQITDDEIGVKKQCTGCDKVLLIKNFFIKDPIKKTYRSKCRSCHSQMSRDLKKKIAEDNSYNKKTCIKCDNTYDKVLFFKDNAIDSIDGYLSTCIQCYNNDIGTNCKHCGNCDKIKTIENFAFDKSKLGNRSSQCKECKASIERERRVKDPPKRKICDVCHKEVSPSGFAAHKRTATCLAIADIKII